MATIRVAFLLLLLVCNGVKAQEKLFGEYIGWKNIGIDLHEFNNATSSCLVLINEDSVKVFGSNNNQPYRTLFTLSRKKKKEKFVGGYIKGDKIFLLLDNATDPGLHSITYYFKSNSFTENTFPFAITKERILGRLSEGEQFFYLTVSKSSPEIVIYRFNNEEHYEIHRYPISSGLEEKISRKSFSLIHIVENSLVPPAISAIPYKSFLQNDTLRFVSNQTPFITDIYEFDLASDYSKYIFFDHEKLYSEEESTDISFLYKNNLYYAAANADSLKIEIVDIHNNAVVKKYAASKEGAIDFKNTPVIKEGGYFGSTRQLEKTSQLLHKMLQGHIALSVTPDSVQEQVKMTVGAYQTSPVFSPLDIVSLGLGISGVFGALNPIIFIDHSWEKTTRFMSVLNLHTGAYISGEISTPIETRIGNYRNQLNPLPQDEALFYQNNYYYYVYYTKQRTLNVVRFNQ
jgi:hypothetical protein